MNITLLASVRRPPLDMSLCNIDVSTGALYESAVDFVLRSEIPFRFSRDYDSTRRRRSPIGYGWIFSQPEYLVLSDESASLVSADGVATVVPHPDRPESNTPSTTAAYDNSGGVILTTGNSVSRHFSPIAGVSNRLLLTSHYDANGNSLDFQYWADGTPHSIIAPDGRRLAIWIDGHAHIRRLTLRTPDNVEHEIAQFEYDSMGDLRSVTHVTYGVTQYEYSDHRLIQKTNCLGGKTFYQYDKAGRCIRTWRDDGTVQRSITWYDAYRHVHVQDSRGAIWIYELDENGRILRSTDPAGVVSQNHYDARGQLLFETRAGQTGRVTFSFPEKNLSLTKNGAVVNTLQRDDKGRMLELKNGLGGTWRYSYDDRSHRVAMFDFLERVWEFRYSNTGWLQSAVDPLGHTITRGRLRPLGVEYRDEIGFLGGLRYDWLGQLSECVNGSGHVTRIEYSSSGYPSTIHYADGTRTAMEFDRAGNLIADIDETGAAALYEYDSFSRPTACVDASGRRGEFLYDSEDNLIGVRNFNNEWANIQYDLAGRVTGVRMFDGRSEYYDYDDLGVRRVLDGQGNVLLEIQHDDFGRIGKKIYAGGWEVSLEWGAQNQLVAARNPSATLEIDWTPDLRIAAEKVNDFTVRYTYDARGRCTRLATSDGRRIEYEWDARNRLTGITDDGRATYRFEYNEADLFARWLCPSVEQTFDFDMLDRMIRRTVAGVNGGAVLADRRYRYDARGLLAGFSDFALGEFSIETSASAVITAIQSSSREFDERLTYDNDLNLTRTLAGQRIVYGAGGRLLRSGETQFSFDGRGSLSEIRSPGRTVKLEYDPEGHLASVDLEDGRKITYAYDPLGRRLTESIDGVTRRFTWSHSTLLSERSERCPAMEYLFLPGTFLPLGWTAGGKHYTFALDQAGTPTEIFGPDGEIHWAGHFSTFGEGFPPRVNRVRNPFCFQGHYIDEETGFQYARYRYYLPDYGRYLSQDPLGLRASSNLYRYVLNPKASVDPLGLWSFANGVLTITPICGWGPQTLAEAQKKQGAMNARLKVKGGVTFPPTPHQRCSTTAKQIHEDCGKTLSETDDKCTNQQADHILEICMDKTGEKDCTNLQPLSETVNKSYGSQVAQAVRANPGAVLKEVVLAPQKKECTENENVDCP